MSFKKSGTEPKSSKVPAQVDIHREGPGHDAELWCELQHLEEQRWNLGVDVING